MQQDPGVHSSANNGSHSGHTRSVQGPNRSASASFVDGLILRSSQPQWWGAVAVITAAAIASPNAVFARSPMRGHTANSATVRRVAPTPQRISVSVGWTNGAERASIVTALSAAVEREPRFQWTTQTGTMVVNATVRTLATTREGLESLVRCEVALVVTDAGGAVQATLDTRRVVRSSAEPTVVAQDALRSALTGAVHRLATSI